MGKGPSRIISSLLGPRPTTSRDTAGQALFRVRASSMESISTTFSLGTLSHTTRSNSVDDLSLPIHRMRSKQDGRKTYLLLDNVSESVPGEATRGGEEQEREKEQREEKLSQSLPGASKACVQRPARKSLSEPEGLSTTLGTQQQHMFEEVEDERNPDNSLEGFAATFSSHQGPTVPEIPDSLAHRLSQEEWYNLIGIVKDHLEFSLHASLQDKLGPATTPPEHQQECRTSEEDKEAWTTASGAGEESELPHSDHSCDCSRPDSRRRRNKERPTSLPPFALRGVLDVAKGEGSADGEAGPTFPQLDLGSRSRSHDDCYRHRCAVPEPMDTAPRHCCRRHCDCRVSGRRHSHNDHASHSHKKSRRRKITKSASRDTPVDVSLDDNCPGLPENRVRRSTQRHTHSHAVCSQCLENIVDAKHRSRHVRQLPLPPAEEDNLKQGFHIQLSNGTKYVTLEELQKAALLLRQSTGYTDDEVVERGQSSAHPLQHSESFGRLRKHTSRQRDASKPHRSKGVVRGGANHLRVNEVSKNPRSHTPPVRPDYNGPDYHGLIFPPRSRNGRISPATDMAVANLDLNSPSMLVPMATDHSYSNSGSRGLVDGQRALSLSDSSLNNQRVGDDYKEGTKHLHLHSHHHFHHVIHHSQP